MRAGASCSKWKWQAMGVTLPVLSWLSVNAAAWREWCSIKSKVIQEHVPSLQGECQLQFQRAVEREQECLPACVVMLWRRGEAVCV